MLIAKLVLQVLVVGLLVLTITLDYWAHDKRTRRFKRLRLLLYCAAGLFLVISLGVTIGDHISRKEEIAALKVEVNRGLYRIEDLGIEFVISLQMEDPSHPGITIYANRILPALHALSASLDRQQSPPWGITVPFISNSPLLPDLTTERVAYTFLSHVCIGLEIFSDSVKADRFVAVAGHRQGRGDLVFLLSRSAGKAEKSDVFLTIEINRKRFSLFSVNAKTGPSRKSTGRVVSVPDLAGATAVMYFCPISYRDEAEKRELLSIANERRVEIFGLNLSGGQQIYLRPEGRMNKYGERVYVLKFPKTAKEIEALLQR